MFISVRFLWKNTIKAFPMEIPLRRQKETQEILIPLGFVVYSELLHDDFLRHIITVVSSRHLTERRIHIKASHNLPSISFMFFHIFYSYLICDLIILKIMFLVKFLIITPISKTIFHTFNYMFSD